MKTDIIAYHKKQEYLAYIKMPIYNNNIYNKVKLCP